MAETSKKVTPWENYDYEPKLIDFWETFGLIGGYSGYAVWKWKLNRPLSGKTRLAMLSASLLGGFLISKVCVRFRNKYMTGRQVYIEDFIDQHPDDFAEAQAKKYKDVLLPWTPHR